MQKTGTKMRETTKKNISKTTKISNYLIKAMTS